MTVRCLLLIAALLAPGLAPAQVPSLLNYQGRVAVNGANYDGTGQFKFALVNAAGTVTYWSNDGTSAAGGAPIAAVSLPVAGGLYSVLLGDASLANMTAVPASVFANADVRLRVWFNDGVNGFQLLAPDQRLAAAGYAMQAATVPAGAIGTAQLANGAVGSAQLAPGAVAPPLIAATGTVSAAANVSYAASGSGLVSFNLPTAANAGDVVSVTGLGAGGWAVNSPDWTPRESSRNWYAVASSADGSRLLAAAYNGFLYTSTDRGLTWTPRDSARRWISVACSADGQQMLAVTDNSGILYTSSDGGQVWGVRAISFSTNLFSIACSASSQARVVGTSNGFLYVSNDSGQTYTARLTDAPRYWSAVACSADGSRMVAADIGRRIYTSADSGQTWAPTSLPNNIWGGLACSADGLKIVAAGSGNLYTSADGGVNWTVRDSGRTWTAVACSGDGNLVLALPTNSPLRVSTDFGLTWVNQDSSRAWSAAAMSTDGFVRVAAVTNGNLYTYGPGLAVTGAQGQTAQFQSLGNGGWRALTPQLAPGSVGAAQLADGAVTTAKLADASITPAKLTLAAVGSAQLAPNLTLAGATALAGNLQVDAAGANAGGLSPGLQFGDASSGEGIASRRTAGTGQFGLSLFTSGQARISILGNGNVGIGTTNPTLARLQVAGSVSSTLTYGYLNNSGATGTANNSIPISIHASDRVAATEFDAYSDARIKEVIGRSDAAADLRVLRGIEITDYTFKDRVAKGDGSQKKVIAQQVETVFPQAVSRLTDVVPDLYCPARMGEDGWIESDAGLRPGERVRLIAEGEQGVFEVRETRPGAFRTALSARLGAPVFVYGREVSDFRTVDYEAISMLNVSATQELARRLERAEAELRTAQVERDELRTRLDRLERLLAPAVAVRKAVGGKHPR